MAKAKYHEPYIAFKRALAARGLTYKDVAGVLDVSESTIQLKINGYSDFYISEQKMICETFKIDTNIFFTSEVA